MTPAILVALVAWSGQPVERVDTLMESAGLEMHEIECVNWPDRFPARPRVRFRIAHSGDEIFIKYYVREPELRATFAEDNGRPWTDSCVEFFFSPAGNDTYYNLEMACNGRGILHGKTADGRELPHDVVARVRRVSSLGTEAFGVRNAGAGEEFEWTLTMAIPAEVYSLEGRAPKLSGLVATGNFYKCGDELATPHFLSWAPIDTPAPSFHQPRFFGTLRFE